MLKLKKLMNNQGFTLVELLIVIAVIGILAVAVLAALNPIEQLRKGRDSSRLADSRELLNAVQRYQLARNCYPWENTAAAGDCNDVTEVVTSANPDFSADFGAGMFGDLITSGELKPSFENKPSVNDDLLFVTENASTNGISVCFEPESTTGRTGGLGINQSIDNAAAATECNDPYGGDGTVDCFLCIE